MMTADAAQGSPGALPPLDRYAPAAWGMRRYVRLVAEALDLDPGACTWDLNRPVGAYLPLNARLPDRPDHDLALTWNEEDGWSAALEFTTRLEPVASLPGDRLPEPSAVAAFVAQLLAPGAATRPASRTRPGRRPNTTVLERLSAYHARTGEGV